MAKSQIVLPKVTPFFKDGEAGRRVDEVLTKLTAELQTLKAADTAAVGGQDAATVGSSGVFFQTFENPITTWVSRVAGTAVTYPSNGRAGGKALRATGGEVFFEFPENIPFNDDRLYRVRARFRMTAAPTNPAKDLVYVGVQGYAADGVTLVDRNGTTTPEDAHWYAAAAVDMGSLALNTWYTYTGYMKGWGAPSATPSTDADAPRALHANVRYIRPAFRLNAAAGNGTMEIDYISLEVLTEGTEGNQLMKDVVNLGTGEVASNKVPSGAIQASAITTDKLNANAVTAAKIAAGTITANEIAANTITAAKIAANTITVNQLASLTGGGLTINFAATGSNPVLSHSKFSLLADGTASFAGALSAASGTFGGSLNANSIELRDGAGSLRGSIGLSVASEFSLKNFSGTTALTVGSSSMTAAMDIFFTSSAALRFDGGAPGGMTFDSNGIKVNGSLTTASAGASASLYLKFNVNGTTYKVALLNNT